MTKKQIHTKTVPDQICTFDSSTALNPQMIVSEFLSKKSMAKMVPCPTLELQLAHMWAHAVRQACTTHTPLF